MVEYLNFHTIAAFLAALLVGGMGFFSFAVAPVAFRSLGRERAAEFLSHAFPVYYRSMAVCSVGAALFIYYRWEAAVFAVIGAVFIAVDLLLRPRIEALRPARQAGDEAAKRRFARWHGLSVVINLGQWLGAVVLFFRLAV